MHLALIGLVLVLLCGGAVRIFQKRTHDRLKGKPKELGVAINTAAKQSK
jgi:hypothetical protein